MAVHDDRFSPVFQASPLKGEGYQPGTSESILQESMRPGIEDDPQAGRLAINLERELRTSRGNT